MSQRAITDLVPGKIYYWKVRAKRGDDLGQWSSTLVDIASIGGGKPSTPNAPDIQSQILRLVASWADMGTTIGTYEVHIKPTTDGDYVHDPVNPGDPPGWQPKYGNPTPSQNTYYGSTASNFASIDRYFNQSTLLWEPLKAGVTYSVRIIAVGKETLTPGGPSNKSDPSLEGFGQVKIVTNGDGAAPPDPTLGPIVEGHIGFFAIDMSNYTPIPDDFLGFELFYATRASAGDAWSAWTTLGIQNSIVLHGPLESDPTADDYVEYKYAFTVNDVETTEPWGGKSHLSPETEAGFPPQAGEGDITVGSIKSKLLDTEILLGERLITTGTTGESRVIITGHADDAGIYLVQGDGTQDTGATVSIPINGNPKFAGILEATGGLTVSGPATFTSSQMVMSSGSQLLLTSNIPDPTNPPGITKSWDQTAIPVGDASKRGVNYDSSTGHYFAGDGVGFGFWEIAQDGAQVRHKLITPFNYSADGIVQKQKTYGAVRTGTNIWILCQSEDGTKVNLRRFAFTDLALLDSVNITNFLNGKSIGGFTYDATNNVFLITEKGSFNTQLIHSFPAGALKPLDGLSPGPVASSLGYKEWITNLDDATLVSGSVASRIPYDIQAAEGFWWVMISSDKDDLIYRVNPATGNTGSAAVDRAFPYQGDSVRGLAHDGTRFWSFGASKMFRHTTWDVYNSTTAPTVYVRYAWLDSVGSESAIVTEPNFTKTPRRQKMIVTTPDFPVGVHAIRVYAEVSDGETALSTYEAQSDGADIQTSSIDLNNSLDNFFVINTLNTLDDVHTPSTVSGIAVPFTGPAVIKSANWELNSNDRFKVTTKGGTHINVLGGGNPAYTLGPLTTPLVDGQVHYNTDDDAFYGISNQIYSFMQPLMTFTYGLDLTTIGIGDFSMYRAVAQDGGGVSAIGRNWGIPMAFSGSVVGLSYIAGTSLSGSTVTFKVQKNNTNMSGVTLDANDVSGSTRFSPSISGSNHFTQDDTIKPIVTTTGDPGTALVELFIWVLRNG